MSTQSRDGRSDSVPISGAVSGVISRSGMPAVCQVDLRAAPVGPSLFRRRGGGEGPPLSRSDTNGGPDGRQIEDLDEITLVSVYQGVVVATEQAQIAEDGLAPFRPRLDVVHVAPPGGAGATPPDAGAIPGDDRPTQGGRDHPGSTPDIEDLRATTPDDARDG
jgi:hypothetical protein